jgi:hypothetical protein
MRHRVNLLSYSAPQRIFLTSLAVVLRDILFQNGRISHLPRLLPTLAYFPLVGLLRLPPPHLTAVHLVF